MSKLISSVSPHFFGTRTTRRIMLLVFEGHPLYEKEAVSVQDLKNEKLLTVGHGYQMFATLQKACLKASPLWRRHPEASRMSEPLPI